MKLPIVRVVATLTAMLLISPLTAAADNLYAGMEPLPVLKSISPHDGAIVENPMVIIFETQADLSKMIMGGMMKGGEKTQEGMIMRPHLHIDLDKRVTMPTTKHIIRSDHFGINTPSGASGTATTPSGSTGPTPNFTSQSAR